VHSHDEKPREEDAEQEALSKSREAEDCQRANRHSYYG
jgi:hypothetical protein